MLIEMTEKNKELFREKSNDDTADIMFMYKGVYRIFNLKNILYLLDSLLKVIIPNNPGIITTPPNVLNNLTTLIFPINFWSA